MAHYIFFTIIIFNLFLFSCSTIVQPPPRESVERIKQGKALVENLTLAEGWVKKYLEAVEAKSSNKLNVSCLIFKDLAEIKDFPLAQLSLVHTIEVCPYSKEELINLWDSFKPVAWLKEFYLSISLQKAKELKIYKYASVFSAELIKFQKHDTERSDLAKVAFEYADLSTDERLIQDATKILYKHSPRFNKEVTSENIFSVARDYEKNREFDQARKLYYQIIESVNVTFDEKIQSYDRICLSYKNQRDRKIYQEKNREMLSFIEKEAIKSEKPKILNEYYKQLIQLARIVWTDEGSRSASKILQQVFDSDISNGDILANAYWVLGNIYLEEKKNESAILAYKRAIENIKKDTDLKNKINWHLAFTYFKNGKYEESIKYLQTMIDDGENLGSDDLKLQVKYWLGEAYASFANDSKAKSIWEEVVKSDPYSYYGIVARRRLNQPFPVIDNKLEYVGNGNPLFDWLFLLEEKEVAAKYLEQLASMANDPEEILPLISLYYSVGDYRGAINTYFKIDEKSRREIVETGLPIIFPTPFFDLVSEASKQTMVPQSFIYSIMRQESAFDPMAKSGSEAYGLMQMTPETAANFKVKGIDFTKDAKKLYDPKLNIYLGANLLKDLQGKFKNKFILPTASYNAGDHRASKWASDRGGNGALEFIEMIPYTETQKYVKLVTRNYIIYRQLIEKGPFLFPEEIFTHL